MLLCHFLGGSYPGAAKNDETGLPSSAFQTYTCPSNEPPATSFFAGLYAVETIQSLTRLNSRICFWSFALNWRTMLSADDASSDSPAGVSLYASPTSGESAAFFPSAMLQRCSLLSLPAE